MKDSCDVYFKSLANSVLPNTLLFILLINLVFISSLNAQSTDLTLTAKFKFTGEQVLNKASLLAFLNNQSSDLFSKESDATTDINRAKAFNNGIDAKDKDIDTAISKHQSDAGVFAGIKILADIRQAIKVQQEDRDKYQQDFEKQLQQNTKTRGLYLVVLPNTSEQTQWDARKFKETAQLTLKARAIKELNDVFIKTVTQVVNRSEVKQSITSQVSGVMTVDETPFEKRRAGKQDYLMLIYLNVSPMSVDASNSSGTGSAAVSPIYLVNCQNTEEVNSTIIKLGLNETDQTELRGILQVYTDKSLQSNISAKGGISNLWTELNIELEKLNSAIESTRKTEQEKTAQLQKLSASMYPQGMRASTLKDSLQELQKKLEEQRMQIDKQQIEYEAKRLFIKEKVKITINDGAPIEVIAEAILKTAQDMYATYGNKSVYSEKTLLVDKKVEEANTKGSVTKRGELKDVWVHVCIANDDEYKLTMLSTLEVSKEDEKNNSKTVRGVDIATQQPIKEDKKNIANKDSAPVLNNTNTTNSNVPDTKTPTLKSPEFKILYESDGKYEGFVINGKKNGQGTKTWADGKKYKGEWNDDLENGQGMSSWADGDIHKGEYKDGKKIGQGTYTWANGNKYEGEFKDNKINGKGTFTKPTGETHKAEFKDGKKIGQGTCIWANGNKYEGEFKDDKLNGQGTYTWTNGDIYKGEFKDGKRNGQGTYVAGKISNCPNGVKFEGEYYNDSKYKGKVYDKYGVLLYDGYFSNGKPTGTYPLQTTTTTKTIVTSTPYNPSKYTNDVKIKIDLLIAKNYFDKGDFENSFNKYQEILFTLKDRAIIGNEPLDSVDHFNVGMMMYPNMNCTITRVANKESAISLLRGAAKEGYVKAQNVCNQLGISW